MQNSVELDSIHNYSMEGLTSWDPFSEPDRNRYGDFSFFGGGRREEGRRTVPRVRGPVYVQVPSAVHPTGGTTSLLLISGFTDLTRSSLDSSLVLVFVEVDS